MLTRKAVITKGCYTQPRLKLRILSRISSAYVQWGRQSCGHHTLECVGVVMAMGNAQWKSTYECVDTSMDTHIYAGIENDNEENGAFLYITEIEGSAGIWGYTQNV